MAEEDDFDIDIYGDEQPDFVQEPAEQIVEDVQHEDGTFDADLDGTNFGKPPNEPETEPGTADQIGGDYNMGDTRDGTQDVGGATYQAGSESATNPNQTAPQGERQNVNGQGADANATAALRLSDLQWWETEDDLRGWANECSVEDQIKEITFNEHKANGKSKGEVFIELETAQAATALKRKIESVTATQPARKHTIIYTNPAYNPFKTYPKDAPARNREPYKERQQGQYVQPYNQNNFRGRGGFNANNRGNMHMNRGGFNNSFNNQQTGAMGGYGGMNNMMGINHGGSYGNQMGFNRGGGGMMGNRGGFQGNRGRGGMMGNMNMGMMPNMMGNMGMGMGMGMSMGGGIGMNGFAQGQFNPQFFGGNTAQSVSPGNPHGTKRQREG